jgi:hypothetical protein
MITLALHSIFGIIDNTPQNARLVVGVSFAVIRFSLETEGEVTRKTEEAFPAEIRVES